MKLRVHELVQLERHGVISTTITLWANDYFYPLLVSGEDADGIVEYALECHVGTNDFDTDVLKQRGQMEALAAHNIESVFYRTETKPLLDSMNIRHGE